MGTDFRADKLDVVTTNACFLPATMWREVPLSFPNRRGRESAARAVILWSLSTGQAMNRLCIYKRERLCI
ncbi:hypothetical protein SF41_22345 [Salmonella enterica]|nr:hypothetical protein CHC80_24490 [Salmonella enterica subsp. enterica serovar Saintpaul]EAM7689110.1 hypothetical protein [Salmonella enterica]EBD3364993.1 hypothetical protein [Salmonella enterica subsp. enterica serovar Bareilly]EBP3741951.1 hypothetical protein [Salmonella enterica subsp. enterica]EBZ0661060.1 hypothetical protein [Salmonella enterica subsp. enterica serovar Haifa]ECI0937481.1 hypothetical protein [Salmonella enterica subsp. enterica serovar Typhimurium]ECT9349464.1 hyp